MAEKDLNIYLTGAASEGAPQTNPNASLGGNRSGTLLVSVSSPAPVNVTGVSVLEVSPDCGEGTATLAFDSAAHTLSYAAPGDAAGTPADVSSGGKYELYSATAGKYAVVDVTAAALPTANRTDSLSLSIERENLFDSVGSGEAQAGCTEYRGIMVKNDSAYGMNSAIVWIESNTPFPDDTVEIGLEAPSGGGIQQLPDETTPPAGVAFSAADGEANALSMGNLAPGGAYGVWVRRTVSPTQNRYADNGFTLAFKADTV